MRVRNAHSCTWTPEKDKELAELYLQGHSYAELAVHFGTSLSAVEHRRVILRLPSPTKLRGSKDD